MPEGLWQKCPECGEVVHNLELVQNLFHQTGLVLRDDGTGIACFIGDSRPLDREGHMQCELARYLVRERPLFDNGGQERIVAGMGRGFLFHLLGLAGG